MLAACKELYHKRNCIMKNWKTKVALWLALLATVLCMGCGAENVYEPDSTAKGSEAVSGDVMSGESEDGEAASGSAAVSEAVQIAKDGSYTSCEDVALYLDTYGELPGNFITKKEARALGWEGGSLEPYAPGKCIGGDKFGNYEEILPKEDGRTYRECDIDTLGADSRGAKRIVYSSDGLIYYTEDHYGSFVLLYD